MERFEKLLTRGLIRAVMDDFKAGLITAHECRDQLIFLNFGVIKGE